jgi:hypothetical protein
LNINKALRRENKISRRKNGHQVDNRNIFILEEEKVKRKREIEQKRLEKLQQQDSSI